MNFIQPEFFPMGMYVLPRGYQVLYFILNCLNPRTEVFGDSTHPLKLKNTNPTI